MGLAISLHRSNIGLDDFYRFGIGWSRFENYLNKFGINLFVRFGYV